MGMIPAKGKTVISGILLLLFVVIVSLPIFSAGFYSDDMVNSLVSGVIKTWHGNFWIYICDYMNYWLKLGRFFPLSVISSTAVFNYFESAHLYQIVRLTFIWISIFSFAGLIYTVTKNAFNAVLVIILTPLCWSVHDVPDAMVSFAIFLPLVIIFLSWSLISLCRYLESGEFRWLDVSLVMYLLGLSCYEVSIVTFFLVCAFVWESKLSFQQKIRTLKPYFIVTVLYIAVYVVVQNMNPMVYGGVKFSLNQHFLRGFLSQLTSSLPLSFFLLAPHNHLGLMSLVQDMKGSWKMSAVAIYLWIFTFASCLWLIRRMGCSKKSLESIVVLGLALVIMPALLIGISEKYQSLVSLGRGYIPVFVQYSGMACLILGGLGSINRCFRRALPKSIFHVTVSLFLSGILVLSWGLNAAVVGQMNENYYNDRALLESALRHDLLSVMPPGSILVEKLLLWNPRYFYAMYSGKTPADVIDINDRKNFPVDGFPFQNKYYIETACLNGGQQGYVVIGKIHSVQVKYGDLQLTDRIGIENPTFFILAKSRGEYTRIINALHVRFNTDKLQNKILSESYAEGSVILSLPGFSAMLPIYYEPSRKYDY